MSTLYAVSSPPAVRAERAAEHGRGRRRRLPLDAPGASAGPAGGAVSGFPHDLEMSKECNSRRVVRPRWAGQRQGVTADAGLRGACRPRAPGALREAKITEEAH
jgi:hypothetical protein